MQQGLRMAYFMTQVLHDFVSLRIVLVLLKVGNFNFNEVLRQKGADFGVFLSHYDCHIQNKLIQTARKCTFRSTFVQHFLEGYISKGPLRCKVDLSQLKPTPSMTPALRVISYRT